MRALLSPILLICWRHSWFAYIRTLNKQRRRCRIIHTTHPASSAIGVQFRLLSDSGSSNIDNEADGAIRLFLFERGSEGIDAGIIEQAERSRLVDHCVPIREGQGSMGLRVPQGERKRRSYCGLSRVVIGRMRRAMVSRGLR